MKNIQCMVEIIHFLLCQSDKSIPCQWFLAGDLVDVSALIGNDLSADRADTVKSEISMQSPKTPDTRTRRTREI